MHWWTLDQARKPNFYFLSSVKKDLSGVKKKKKRKHSCSDRSDTKSTALSTGSPLKCTAISLLTSAKCLMKQNLTPSFGVRMLPGHLFMRPKWPNCDVKETTSGLWGGKFGVLLAVQKKSPKSALQFFFDSHPLWLFSTQFILLGTTVKAIKARQAYYPTCLSKAGPHSQPASNKLNQTDHLNLIRYTNANTQPHVFTASPCRLPLQKTSDCEMYF